MRPAVGCSVDGQRVCLISTVSRIPKIKNALHKVNHAKHNLFPPKRLPADRAAERLDTHANRNAA